MKILESQEAKIFNFFDYFPSEKERLNKYTPLSLSDFLANDYQIDFIKDGEILMLGEVSKQQVLAPNMTFRLKNMHTQIESLKGLAYSIYKELQITSHINVYISKAYSSSHFHKAGSCLIVWQSLGEKVWEFKYKDRIESLTLKEGQFLFIPQDLTHKATNKNEAPSEHCTISLHTNQANKLALFFNFLLTQDNKLFDISADSALKDFSDFLLTAEAQKEFKNFIMLNKLQVLHHGIPHYPYTKIKEDK